MAKLELRGFIEGERYDYSEMALAAGYEPRPGGNFQRGIVLAPRDSPEAILIKMNLAKALYDDEYEPGSDQFYYIGDGLPEKGHQRLSYGNRIMVDYQEFPVYLFVKFKGERKGDPWRFEGIWRITGIERDFESSRRMPNGERQRVFRFKLRKADRIPDIDRLFSLRPRTHEYLSESDYTRVTPALMKIIEPRHRRLANSLYDWLVERGAEDIRLEHNRIDVAFRTDSTTHMAELKVVYGLSVTRSIREAMGQVFEYNFYPGREPYDRWLIVLDRRPEKQDLRYVERLRRDLEVPLNLGWKSNDEFRSIHEIV